MLIEAWAARRALTMPRLPLVVQQQGIQVAKATKNFLVVVGFVSTDDAMSSADLGDFIASSVQDPISRTNGVGDYTLFGAQYAMRVWLDPAKLDNFGLTPGDVSNRWQVPNRRTALSSTLRRCRLGLRRRRERCPTSSSPFLRLPATTCFFHPWERRHE
jgi:multidrug efflux pump subunit AcrB